MANAQKPTKYCQHMETKHFALQEWVLCDLISLEQIDTADNFADVFTKATNKSIFYHHMDYVMGQQIPDYMSKNNKFFLKRMFDQNVSLNFHSHFDHGRV